MSLMIHTNGTHRDIGGDIRLEGEYALTIGLLRYTKLRLSRYEKS